MAHRPDEKRAKARLRRGGKLRGTHTPDHHHLDDEGMSSVHLRGTVLDRIVARSSQLIEFRAAIEHVSLENPCRACEASLLVLTTSMFRDLIESLRAYAERLPIPERQQVQQAIAWQQLKRELHDARAVTERIYKRV